MGFPSDVTDPQWELLEPLLLVGKRGPRHQNLRNVVDGILYVAHTGCQWRFLPGEYGAWTRLWSQFRRWTRNGTWVRLLSALHRHARVAAGRTDPTPSLVVVDTHLARGSSNGGATFHNQGGPFGRVKGAKRAVAVDVTGLPLAAIVVPASVHKNQTTGLLLSQVTANNSTARLEVVLTDKGVTGPAAARLSVRHGIEVRRVGWNTKPAVFRPIRHAWRVEVAHGKLLRSRRLAKSFENTVVSATGWLQVACIKLILKQV